MSTNYIGKNSLTRFLEKLYETFSKKGHAHSKADILDFPSLEGFATESEVDSMMTDLNSVIDAKISYTEQQGLTEDQKILARENIGAVSIEEVEELLGIEEGFNVTGELVQFDLDIEPGTELNVVSKIHRDSTWGESNKLVLHHVSGNNFVDLSSYLGGAGKVYEKNGLTATINANSTMTVQGTNSSTGWTNVFKITDFNSDYSKRVYPAGTYAIPSGLTIQIRAAQYPGEITISGATGNLTKKFTSSQPFRVISMFYAVAGSATVDKTLPLGLFRSDSVPEVGYEYVGNIYIATFDRDVYDGEYNWTTGELKDVDGNTIAYYDSYNIVNFPGTNYFWTGFGENTISNKTTTDLEKVVIGLGDSAPEETVPSICDFTLTPITKNYSINVYGDSRYYFKAENNLFYGMEIPLVTTRGNFIVTNPDGLDECKLPIPELINYSGITDTMTWNKVTKRWSDRFYITREPDFTETIDDGSGNTATNPNTVATWIFSKKEFEKYGLPIEATDIPTVSPIFTTVTNDTFESRSIHSAEPYAGVFSYDAVNDNYVLKCKAKLFYAGAVYNLTKGYFCYPLKEEVCRDNSMLSLYLAAGYSVRFERDDAFDAFWQYSLTQNFCPFYNDSYKALWNTNTKPADESSAESLIDVTPNVGIFVPRSVEDVLYEAEHIAKRLNYREQQLNDYEANSYQWIGKGDGSTDYTDKIQSKLTELHNTTKGGTVYLGSGTYPISGSLLVYDNTRIIGDGQTVIEQKSDNTHALVLCGSGITIEDLSIKLSGECTEITACIYVNSYNKPSDANYEAEFPETTYVHRLTVDNVYMSGGYRFGKEDGYDVVSDAYDNYKGVGICGIKDYYNYAHIDNVHFKHLMAGVYGGGGACYHNIVSEFCKYAVYGNGSNNTYFIEAHPYYGTDKEGHMITMSEAIIYVYRGSNTAFHLKSYDTQGYKNLVYLGSKTLNNTIFLPYGFSTGANGRGDHPWNILKNLVVDFGRGNIINSPIKDTPFHIGSHVTSVSRGYHFELCNTAIQNALSGAGIWGNISSNVEFESKGISLRDVCRYPSKRTDINLHLPYILSKTAPSAENPIEIVIDYSNRPIIGVPNFVIQFHHNYVASDYQVSFDLTNTGVFEYDISVEGNNNIVDYYHFPQRSSTNISYRMKIRFTKPLQIANLTDAMNGATFDYNPDGLIGICNIALLANDYAGRSFLGECGGDLYGDVDMHQNTLKNLPDPVDDGDAVSKSYADSYADSKIKNLLNLDYITDAEHIVPEGADLNTYITPGTYRISSKSISETLLNTPANIGAGARLIVSATSSSEIGVIQIIIYNTTSNEIFLRTQHSTGDWCDWASITNYLSVDGGTVNGDVTVTGGLDCDYFSSTEISSDTASINKINGTNIALTLGGVIGTAAIDSSGKDIIIPSLYTADENIHVGMFSNANKTHSGSTYINALKGSVFLRNSNSASLQWAASGTDTYDNFFRASDDALTSCGTGSHRWYRVYNSTASCTTSDAREKSDITAISDYPVMFSRDSDGNVFDKLFDRLVPTTYSLNFEKEDKMHIGFIAQDVEKAAEEVGLPVENLGLIVHDFWTDEDTGEERDRYSLGYEQFIALNTYVIQKQKEKIESLEERIAKLEALVNT